MNTETKTLDELEKEKAELETKRVAVQDYEGLKRDYFNICREIDKLKETEAKAIKATGGK